MKKFLPIFLLLSVNFLEAQDTKGLSPIPTTTTAKVGNTYAVVVGVSDYQHKDIPDLKYAHKDAEGFSNWLKSPAGGSVVEENITLLTNEKATVARFAASLELLIDQTKEGDLAIIYFSGHSDVEQKTAFNYGFLLLNDSPALSYVAGAYPVFYLQGIISTLSQEKKAKVLVISDACHAGKLAGSSINGTQATAAALSKQFANEVKIMSCQPNEYSLEGTQWGGGRGAFSYHLIDGLTGLADRNNDQNISLNELDRYLEDHVTIEAQPQSQNPFSSGDKQTKLAMVNTFTLAKLKEEKSKDGTKLAFIQTKGIENQLLMGLDSVTKQQYKEFGIALDSGFLFAPRGHCANDLFDVLIQNEGLKSLHNIMKINFAVALQDEVQQAINALLDNDPYEANNWRYNPTKYKDYPMYLEKAISLLGTKHYIYKSLKAKQLYFEGYNIYNTESMSEQDPIKREAAKKCAKSKFLEAATFEPQAAYIYQAIGNMYWYNNPFQTDSLVKYCDKAIELSPTWAAPYFDVSYEYGQTLMLDKSELYLNKINKLVPRSYSILERLSWLKQWQFNVEESMAITDTLLKMRPELFNANGVKGVNLLFLKGDFINAEKEFDKSMALFDSPNNWSKAYLGVIYLKTGRVAKGKAFYFDMINDTTLSADGSLFIAGYLGEPLLNLRDYEALQRVVDIYSKSKQLGVTQMKMLEIFKGVLAKKQNNFVKADSIFQYGLSLFDYVKSPDFSLFTELGELSKLQNKQEETKKYFLRADSLAAALCWSDMFWCHYDFLRHVNYWQSQNDNVKVDKYLNLLKKHANFGWETPFAEALIAAKKGNQKASIKYLEKSIDQYLPTFDYITEEPLFDFLKESKKLKQWKKKGIRNDEK